MTFARKSQAKYGAQIPTSRKPGTQPAQQGKAGDTADNADTAAKTPQAAKSTAPKKA